MADPDSDSFNDSEFDESSDEELECQQGMMMETKKADPFTTYNNAQLLSHINSNVQQISTNLNLNLESAMILYTAFNYNLEKTLADATVDRAAALQFAGLPLSDEPWNNVDLGGQDMVECDACMDDVAVSETSCLHCGHRFCNDCWRDYFKNYVSRRGGRKRACQCLQEDCNAAVPKSFMLQLGVEPEIVERLDGFACQDFVQAHFKVWKWCPGLNCNCAVKLNDLSLLNCPTCTVKCDQKHGFCFLCGHEDHSPVNCIILEQWLEKCSGESENAQWIIANTRKCKRCNTRIEKNHGCNHMICTKCHYEFCWVCMGDWKDHGVRTGGFYKCNRFQQKQNFIQGPRTTEDENDLFLHFFNRYANHDSSQTFALRHRPEIIKKMEAIQRNHPNLTWQDVQFLKEASEKVESCRRILKYTYVFGYNLQVQRVSQHEIELFEFLQQQLERNTEFLHEMTEQPLECIDREEITNYTRITAQFAEKLLEGIATGLRQIH